MKKAIILNTYSIHKGYVGYLPPGYTLARDILLNGKHLNTNLFPDLLHADLRSHQH
jgi:hypothetical protein